MQPGKKGLFFFYLFMMFASWIQALRAYVARQGPPSTLASRHQLYDQLARTHLAVLQGEQRLRPDSLAVLREARWALLRDGTTREKADLLEHILKSLSRASDVVTYESTTAATRSRSHESGGQHSRTRRGDASSPSSSANATPASSSQNLSERHQLLLEQLQCLVEAKVADIPLTARHYRYPLRSPLLAEVSPELPLLMLEELARQPQPSTQRQAVCDGQSQAALTGVDDARASAAEWEARVDCGASLAGAGHVHEALDLCGDDGRMFRAVLQRVARQRRDGWRAAWTLAEAVPMERVAGVAAASPSSSATPSSYSEDWLRGVLEAVRLRFRAAPPRRPQSLRDDDGARPHEVQQESHPRDTDESEQLFAWVDQLRQLLMAPRAKQARPPTYALQRAQRLVMDAYLAVCPPRRWRKAVGVVLELKASQSLNRTRSGGGGSDDDDVVSAGRLMALLQFAQQPHMTLLFFYGNPLDVCVACNQGKEWSVSNDVVQLAVERLVHGAAAANRLSVATGALLSERDVHHAAVYNHAMGALAAIGRHAEAMLFYDTMPVACVNAYTHWSVLQAFLQPNSASSVAAALESTANYEHCQRALKRLVCTTSNTSTPTTTASPSFSSRGEEELEETSFTRDQANVWESMTLWAALRRDADTALLCATHAPPSCRYARLIALIAAANMGNGAAVHDVLRQLCRARHTTHKELCLAAAATALYYPMMLAHSQVSAATPALVPMYDELTHALGRNVGHQQARMDEVVQLLIDYAVSLQRRRALPLAADGTQAALQDVLVKAKILNSTMDLVRLGSPQQQRHSDGEGGSGDATAVWRTVARLIQSVGSQQDLSVAHAAPALVSAGAPAEMAIDLLPL